MATRPGNLSDSDYRKLEFHISKGLDIVGLDHNFTDGILEAFEDAVAIAEENHDDCQTDHPTCMDDRLPKPPAEHRHFWKRQQNVTSRGYAMPSIEVCDCGTARRATDPEPESVTVTLPRDVVEARTTGFWRETAANMRHMRERKTAALLDALADALDAA